MADFDFENQLEKMFADAAPLPDRDLFAQAVVHRLERGWRLRRLVIGAAGVAGGVIGVAQVLRSSLVLRIEDLKFEPVAALYKNAADLSKSGLHAVMQPYTAYSSEVLWAAAGLAMVAVALAAMRMVGEF